MSVPAVGDNGLMLNGKFIKTVLKSENENEVQGIVFNGGVTSATSVQVVPETFTSGWTDFSNMFYSYNKLTTVPQFDTSSGTDFSYMFAYCTQLTTVSQLDTSNGTNFFDMFYHCYHVTTVPQFDTSSGKIFGRMFDGCTSLTTIPQLDVPNGTDFRYMFQDCESLTTFGGFLHCKKSYDLSDCPRLTHDSLMNAINGLYDMTGQTGQTLTLGAINLAKLSNAEKSVATNKNWTLA